MVHTQPPRNRAQRQIVGLELAHGVDVHHVLTRTAEVNAVTPGALHATSYSSDEQVSLERCDRAEIVSGDHDVKRDMELIRKFALALESSPTGYTPDQLTIDGDYTDEQIGYHAYLMIQYGLAQGLDLTHIGSAGPRAQLTRLTWAGHEFAEAAREDRLWRKAMVIVGQKGGAVTIEILTELLKRLMRAALLPLNLR